VRHRFIPKSAIEFFYSACALLAPVLNKESRLERCLEDDLLAGGYHFIAPSNLKDEKEQRKHVALLRISLAQMRMARDVMRHDVLEAHKVVIDVTFTSSNAPPSLRWANGRLLNGPWLSYRALQLPGVKAAHPETSFRSSTC
jgi:hypothetical protein